MYACIHDKHTLPRGAGGQEIRNTIVAVFCSVLQCAAVCCGVLWCVVVCCGVLWCVVVCCSVLQCVAVYRCRAEELAEESDAL